jgi:hypothetical protein
MRKELTREQVAGRKDKAVRFLRTVLEDDDRADEVEAESVEDYAARRHFMLSNPTRRGVRGMPQRESKADVEADRDELLDKVEELRDLADDILSEYEPEEEEESEQDDGGDSSGEDDS